MYLIYHTRLFFQGLVQFLVFIVVIHGEVDIDKEHEQVRAAGDKWLNDLPVQRRAQVLGRAGAEAWEDGADWRKYMRGFSGFREAESRLKNISGKGIIEATKIWKGHNSLPKKSQPNDVIDHVGKNGAIKTRAFYDASGFKYKEIHTTNHGKPKAHPFGIHGEHGHDYAWNLDGSLKNKTSRELTNLERKENQNII